MQGVRYGWLLDRRVDFRFGPCQQLRLTAATRLSASTAGWARRAIFPKAPRATQNQAADLLDSQNLWCVAAPRSVALSCVVYADMHAHVGVYCPAARGALLFIGRGYIHRLSQR